MTKAAVLFSGGLDSTTALAWALRRYDQVFPLTFDYGQRHRLEVRMAARAARRLKLPHAVLKIDLGQVGGSALTDGAIAVPSFTSLDDMGDGPPSTYVPFRNGVLLSLAAAWAETRDIRHLVTGFNVIDSPHYPDTRPDFVLAMEAALNAGTRAAFDSDKWKILAPFIGLKKSEIIAEGLFLGVDYSYAISCYAGGEVPCGTCSSCLLRQKAWQEAGRPDPLLVRLAKEKKR